VIDVTPEGLMVREIVEGLSFEELEKKTEAPLKLANGWCPLVAKPAH
jgi:3-oxoadipate CoA-transferase beta subunit